MSVTLAHPLLAATLLALALALCLAISRRSRAEGSRLRLSLALLLRMLVLLPLVLALSGLQWKRERPECATVFAVDSSDSMRGAPRTAAAAWISDATKLAKRGDRRAVVQFGRDALIEEGLSDALDDVALASQPRPDASDLGAALKLSRALLPPDGRRRIVAITDGEVDVDSAAAGIRRAREEGCDVLLVPLAAERGLETLVEELVAPEKVHENEPFEVRVVLRASAAASGTLTITDNGTVLGQQQAEAAPGAPTVLRFVGRHRESGTHLYRAHWDAEPDGFAQNDAAEALVRVEGQPSVLVIDPKPEETRGFVALLEAGGMRVDVHGLGALPTTLAEASRHDAIVLSNVESLDLATRQMEVLAAYVRETGGGLLMAGGPDSFGPGGWYRTPVEDALPVDMDVRSEKYYPSLTMIPILDKSGSMGAADGASKMDLAKEAAALTVELLQTGDRVGIVAFDSAAKWVVPITDASSKAAVTQRIGTIRAGGGTDIYPALAMAGEAIVRESTVLKHLILLTDGQSPPRDYQKLIGELAAQHVTLSTIAIGADADLFTLQHFAEWGRGRYYYTDDASAIPRIFTKEAFTSARSFVVEEAFVPHVVREHSVLRGIAGLPSLSGYVATTLKPAAELVLATPREDPLLAIWRFGLGRSAAWTSDLGARWAPAWMESEGGRTVAAQLVRHLASRVDSSNLRVDLSRDAANVVVSVEARDEDGGYLNFATLRASVVGPDLVSRDVTLRQVAPGRYRGAVPAGEPGPVFAGVLQHEGSRIVRSSATSAVFPYSEEYRTVSAGGDALLRLAQASGARIAGSPEEAFARTGPPAVAMRSAWREAIQLSAFLFLLDVAMRRVMLPTGWLALVLARIAAWMPRRRARVAPGFAPALARLRGAKEAVRAQQGASAAAPLPVVVPKAGSGVLHAGTPNETVPDPTATGASGAGAPEPVPTPATAGAPAAPAEGDAAFASRLLAAKRRARKDS